MIGKVERVCATASVWFLALSATLAGDGGPVGARGLALAAAGDVAPDLVEYVRAHLEKECECPVRMLPPIRVEAPESDAVAEDIRELRGNDVYAAVLYAAPLTETRALRLEPEDGLCTVNATHLRTAPSSGYLAPAVYRHRLEKETLRAVALLAGLEDCQWPRCALHPHRTVEELDFKSRNLCPPCQDRLREALQRSGVAVERPQPPTVAGGGEE